MRLKTSYSAREVAGLTGLTARQLQGWDAGRVFQSAIAPRRTSVRRLHRTPVHAGRRARTARAGGAAAARVHAGGPAADDGHAARLLPPPPVRDAGRCRRHAAADRRRGLFLRTRQGHIFDLLADPTQPLVTGDGLPLSAGHDGRGAVAPAHDAAQKLQPRPVRRLMRRALQPRRAASPCI